MKFRLAADITLDAENIDDALRILGEYFEERAYMEEGDAPKHLLMGEIKMMKLEDSPKPPTLTLVENKNVEDKDST